jgi:hypothetical protein
MGSRILLSAGLFILSVLPVWSQTEEWKDGYSRLSGLTPWVMSSNPAGLSALPVDKVSTVRVGIEKTDGGLMDLHESPDCFRPSLEAASLMKISDRIVFYGRMDYSYFKGRKMGGQILMDPYYNPVNFLESVDTTTGTKTLEEYTLEGAMAYSLTNRLSLAGKVSYQSADYAKRKDPRAFNQWMDLDASLGVRYSLAGGKGSFGASLDYTKTIETVIEELFGTVDRQYYCLVDYGGSFGKIEVIDGDNGYISTGNERPMFNQFFGGSAQAELRIGAVDAFVDFGAAYRKGYFGKKASGSVRFCDFDGMRYNLDARLQFRTGGFLNRIDGNWNALTSVNKENSYRISTTQGQNSEVQYFGSQEVGDKTVSRIKARYTLERRAEGAPDIFNPSPWAVFVGYERFGLDQTATSYPFYRKQRLAQNTVDAVAARNFRLRSGYLSFTLGARYSFAGDDLRNEDGQYSSASGNPRTNDTYLGRNYEYFHATSAGGSASLRFTLLKTVSGRRYSIFADISDSYRRLLSEPVYLTGNYRNTIIFTIGCNF